MVSRRRRRRCGPGIAAEVGPPSISRIQSAEVSTVGAPLRTLQTYQTLLTPDFSYVEVNMFKRSAVHYGRTPQPVTPYQKAAQVWDDRIGSARVQARNWRLMAFGCLFLSAASPLLSSGSQHRGPLRLGSLKSIASAKQRRSRQQIRPTRQPTRKLASISPASSNMSAASRWTHRATRGLASGV